MEDDDDDAGARAAACPESTPHLVVEEIDLHLLSVEEAMDIIEETHQRWRRLCGHSSDGNAFIPEAGDFWLSTPSCRGVE